MAGTRRTRTLKKAEIRGVIDLTVQERSLHLVDLENLLGDPWVTGPRVGWALEQYFAVAGWRVGGRATSCTLPPTRTS